MEKYKVNGQMTDQGAERREEQLAAVGEKILKASRSALYLKMRFLDVALCSLFFVPDPDAEIMGTDGLVLYYCPEELGRIYQKDPVLVQRLYLHEVLHGIFRHMIRRKGKDEEIYWLACDIAVESIIDGLKHRAVQKSRSFLRRETYRKLNARHPVLTAERIYKSLQEWELSETEIIRLRQEFRLDDHSYWPEDEDRKKQEQIENQWRKISEQTETDMETFSKEASEQAGHFLGQLRVENRARYDYRQFLRKFSVLREELKIDEDAFDYSFYCYGLSLYGNMPLIEPQEWKETQKIEEFVIVIDTSMSCSGELVRHFLEETYGVLSENESFFRKINIHVIQCDDQVQTDQKITCEEELKDYMENLTLKGEGGTDFRPAFIYVEELMREHVFSNLKGLLYFTDGKGIYPAKKPPYETAFVFMKEDYEDTQVPSWAMKLILEEEDYAY